MNEFVAVLAFVVAAQYVIIAVFVVPRLTRVIQADRGLVAFARWGAAAFFIGCAVTHTAIALQTLDPGLPGGMDMAVHGGDGALWWEMVVPHIAQIVGGAVFILIAVRRLAVNITSKEQAAELQALDQQFRSAFDLAPLGFALLAPAGQTSGAVYINPAYMEIYGLDPQGPVPTNQDLLTRVHPDDRAAAAAAMRAVLAGVPRDSTFRIVRPDDAVRWIHARLNPDTNADGAVTRVTTLVEDITDRVDDHTALAHSEQRFRQLADSIGVGINLRQLDPPQFLWGNAAYTAIVGTELAHQAGTQADPAHLLIHPDDRNRVLAQYWPLAQAGQVADSEHRVLRPDGDIRWVHTTSNPVRDDDGTVTRVAGTVEDITARKHAEAALHTRNGKPNTPTQRKPSSCRGSVTSCARR